MDFVGLLPLIGTLLAVKAPAMAFVLTREQSVPKGQLAVAIAASQIAVVLLWIFVVPTVREDSLVFYLSTAMIVLVIEGAILSALTKAPSTQLAFMASAVSNVALVGADLALRHFANTALVAW